MNGVMNSGSSMMGGMGWGGFLVVTLPILGVAALIKYLFFNTKP
jgi:hypothetical protein